MKCLFLHEVFDVSLIFQPWNNVCYNLGSCIRRASHRYALAHELEDVPLWWIVVHITSIQRASLQYGSSYEFSDFRSQKTLSSISQRGILAPSSRPLASSPSRFKLYTIVKRLMWWHTRRKANALKLAVAVVISSSEWPWVWGGAVGILALRLL